MHGRQIDHEAAVADGLARGAVAATADGDEQVIGPGKLDGPDHVGRATALGDQRRTAVDHSVPDLAGPVVAVLARQEQGAPQAGLEILHRRPGQDGFTASKARGRQVTRNGRRCGSRERPGQRNATGGGTEEGTDEETALHGVHLRDQMQSRRYHAKRRSYQQRSTSSVPVMARTPVLVRLRLPHFSSSTWASWGSAVSV